MLNKHNGNLLGRTLGLVRQVTRSVRDEANTNNVNTVFPLEEANNQKRGKLNNNKRKKGKKTKKIIPLDGYPLLITPLRVFLTTV